MQHISNILRAEGFLVDNRLQIIGIDEDVTLHQRGQYATDALLEALAFMEDDLNPRAVVVNPATGTVEQIVVFDQLCPYIPTEQSV